MSDITLKEELGTLEGVDAKYHGLYQKDGEKYKFAVPVAPDVSGLKAKNDELLAEAKTARTERDTLRSENTTLKGKLSDVEGQLASKSGGDADSAWEKKYREDMAEKDKTLGSLRKNVEDITAGAQATALAAKLAVPGSEGILRRDLANRLTTEWDASGNPVVKVRDRDGSVSARSVGELEAEILADPQYKPLLAGTKASGGGQNKTEPGGASTGKKMGRTAFQNMTPADRVKYVNDGGTIVNDDQVAA